MFDMKDPDNKKAFITGFAVGEEMKDRQKKSAAPSGGGGGDFSLLGWVIGILISAAVIIGMYIWVMN